MGFLKKTPNTPLHTPSAKGALSGETPDLVGTRGREGPFTSVGAPRSAASYLKVALQAVIRATWVMAARACGWGERSVLRNGAETRQKLQEGER